jgi:Domain of unknown function (DUF4157)
MESRFGHDFSQVRIHADTRAHESARSVGARAYALGRDIVFARGQYTPETDAGRRLLAHELTHVAQQSAGRRGPTTFETTILEREATAAETAAWSREGRVAISAAGSIAIACKPDGGQPVRPSQGPAMTPRDMYNKLLAERILEHHIPVHQLRAVEEQLKAMKKQLDENPTPALRRNFNTLINRYNLSQLEGPGAPAGTGYSTYAMIQVVDEEGHLVAVATGKYVGKEHAEKIALDRLRKELGEGKLRGCRLDVVTDQEICPSCSGHLEKFATDYEVDGIAGHVFRRPKLTGAAKPKTTEPAPPESPSPAQKASAKTTARTATMRSAEGVEAEQMPPRVIYGRPKLRVSAAQPGLRVSEGAGAVSKLGVAEEIEEAVAEEPTAPRRMTLAPGEPEAAVTPRQVGVATLANIASGITLQILTERFHDEMLARLQNLPRPKADPRDTSSYLRDPDTREGIRIIDLITRNLQPFGDELVKQHTAVVTAENLEIALIAVSSMSPLERSQRLGVIAEELRTFDEQLYTVAANVDAALALEEHLTDLAQGTDQASKALQTVVLGEELLKLGMSYEQLSDHVDTLDAFSADLRRSVRGFKQLRVLLTQLIEGEELLAKSVDRLWWAEFSSALRAELESRKARQSAEKRAVPERLAREPAIEFVHPEARRPSLTGTIASDAAEIVKAFGQDPQGERRMELLRSARHLALHLTSERVMQAYRENLIAAGMKEETVDDFLREALGLREGRE